MGKASVFAMIALITAGSMLLAYGAHNLTTASLDQAVDSRVAAMYQEFKHKFGVLRSSPAEDNFRLNIFAQNLQYIEAVNSRNLGYEFGVNSFSDMLQAEFAATYAGLGNWEGSKFWEQFGNDKIGQITPIDESKYAPSIDWSDKLNPVIHQHSCASCYAFATVAPLELYHFQTFGRKISLSPQEIVDCTGTYGNTGCKGGWMHQAYDYILRTPDAELSLNSAYPYVASEHNFCSVKKATVKNLLKSYVQLDQHRTQEVLEHLQKTVVPSAIDCNGIMFYKSGIMDDENCVSNINHAVTIVGYGNEDGKKYWKIKNTWGKSWGEKGYLRIKRQEKNGEPGQCGTTQYNVIPKW